MRISLLLLKARALRLHVPKTLGHFGDMHLSCRYYLNCTIVIWVFLAQLQASEAEHNWCSFYFHLPSSADRRQFPLTVGGCRQSDRGKWRWRQLCMNEPLLPSTEVVIIIHHDVSLWVIYQFGRTHPTVKGNFLGVNELIHLSTEGEGGRWLCNRGWGLNKIRDLFLQRCDVTTLQPPPPSWLWFPKHQSRPDLLGGRALKRQTLK